MDNQALLASLERQFSSLTPGDFRALESFRHHAAIVVGTMFGKDSQYVADVLHLNTIEPLGWNSPSPAKPVDEWRALADGFTAVFATIREGLRRPPDSAKKRTDDFDALIEDVGRLQFNDAPNALALKKRALAIVTTRFAGEDRGKLFVALMKIGFQGSSDSSGLGFDVLRTRWEQNREQLIRTLTAMRDAIAPDRALQTSSDGQRTSPSSENVFIVHGHQHHLREDVGSTTKIWSAADHP